MFDVGFWELAVIGVIGLLVVGPDKLPGLAREAGLWIGRIRRMAATVKADVKRELDLETLKAETRAAAPALREVLDETREAVVDLKQAGHALSSPPPAARPLSSPGAPGAPTPQPARLPPETEPPAASEVERGDRPPRDA